MIGIAASSLSKCYKTTCALAKVPCFGYKTLSPEDYLFN